MTSSKFIFISVRETRIKRLSISYDQTFLDIVTSPKENKTWN